LISHFDLRQKS